MKKLNYLLLGLAGLTLASCSQDDLFDSQKGDGNYNVTVKLPGDLSTRAVTMNSGLTANILNYAVYDSNGVLVESNQTTFSEDGSGALSTTVGFNLASGQTYRISFFAQAPGSENVYNFDAKAGTMTVNYGAMTNAGLEQDDLYDCFINQLSTEEIGSGVTNTSILLNRPVAQINWGTNDFTQNSIKQYYGNNLAYLQSTLQTTAFTTFDLLENKVDETQTITVNLGAFTHPLQANGSVAGFPVGGYQYMAMQYVMVPADEETLLDLNLAVNNGVPGNTFEGEITNTVEVANAPVQANFRTNIYGALLTDNVDITVTKNQNWGGAYNLPQGDKGEQVSEGLYYNANIKTYTIDSPAGLEYYATKIAPSTGQSMSGYTILLGEDLNMQGVAHTPFNNAGAIFDGMGHTVSNLTVNITEGNGSAGFMSSAIGTVQNINFKDATVSGHFKVGVLAGDGLCAKISNISVNKAVITSTPWQTSNGKYDDGNNCGGIVGYLSGEPNASITNCSVSELTATAYRKVGGIVGYANQGKDTQSTIVENNTVTNSTITANQKINGEYVDTKPFEAGEICGGWSNIATVRNNTPTKVSVITIDPSGKTAASVADQSALQAAVGTPNATINLQPGTYTPPTKVATGVTFTGSTNATIVIGTSMPGGYTDVTFEGIRFSGATINYAGLQHSSNLTYNNCVLDGTFFDFADGITYNNCTFNVTGNNYAVWTYGANNITFSGCTFNTDGKAILAYTQVSGNHNLTVTKCTFKANMPQNGDGPGDGKAAVQINGGDNDTMSPFDVTITNCTESGFSTNTTAGSGLWSVKPNRVAKVTVNNEVVYNK